MGFAILSSICFGAGMPGFCILFGDMVDGIAQTSTGGYDLYKESSLSMLLLAVIMFFFSWFNITLWNIFAARIANKVRFKYFDKCL